MPLPYIVKREFVVIDNEILDTQMSGKEAFRLGM